MGRAIRCFLTAAVCFQTSVVVYFILNYPDATDEMIFTAEETSEERYGLESESLKNAPTKYSSFKNISTQCSQMTFTFAPHVIQPHLNKKKTNIFLLVLVASGVETLYSKRRNSIRSTWGNISTNTVFKKWERFFVLGRTLNPRHSVEIRQEAAVYEDILLLDVTDNYDNLSIKIFSGLLWSLIYVNPRFILKADDDVYVCVPHLVSWLNLPSEHQSGTNLYGGFIHENSGVERKERYKNHVSRDCLAEDFYPPYCAGGSYLLSSSVLPSLFQAIQKRTVIPVEDGYMGILAKEIGLKPIDIPGFHFWRKLENYGKCDWSSAIAVGHGFELKDFIYIEKKLTEANELPRNYYKCLLVHEWVGFVFIFITCLFTLFLVIFLSKK